MGLNLAYIAAALPAIIIALALSTDLFPTYFLKLISAVIVAVALSLPTGKTALQLTANRLKLACVNSTGSLANVKTFGFDAKYFLCIFFVA